jgi:hypothetical protein
VLLCIHFGRSGLFQSQMMLFKLELIPGWKLSSNGSTGAVLQKLSQGHRHQ